MKGVRERPVEGAGKRGEGGESRIIPKSFSAKRSSGNIPILRLFIFQTHTSYQGSFRRPRV